MKILPRTQFGDPILRKKAKKVPKAKVKDPKFQQLIRRMFFTMYRHGVGLAAPQVGVSLQLAVVGLKYNSLRPLVKEIPPAVIINPDIIYRSKETENDWEGCLSLPGVRGLVPRHKKIKVRYIDERGAEHTVTVKGFHARVLQHEIDHLNGILYVDRMRDMKTLITTDEFRKRVAKKGLKSR